MYERKCPNCDGDKIIFENGHFKCAFCDAVFADKTSDKATFKYTAQVYQAKEHLKVGNFERAYEISYKLSDLHPTDPSPYAIMLLSITSKLTVYKLPEDKRNEAADIWRKMEQLNAIAQPMAVYAENMFQKKMNMVKEKVICAAFFIALGVIVLISASCKYPAWRQLFVVLDLLYTCYYCWISQLSNIISIYQMENNQPGQVHNPFLTPLYDCLWNTLKDDR